MTHSHSHNIHDDDDDGTPSNISNDHRQHSRTSNKNSNGNDTEAEDGVELTFEEEDDEHLTTKHEDQKGEEGSGQPLLPPPRPSSAPGLSDTQCFDQNNRLPATTSPQTPDEHSMLFPTVTSECANTMDRDVASTSTLSEVGDTAQEEKRKGKRTCSVPSLF
eukprot:PhM_4_TR8364/c1_g1_i1/m.14604